MVDTKDGPLPNSAAAALGDERALRLLTGLVASAPTNLEDPAHGRYEKPNYVRTADLIVRAAREFGLSTQIYDPQSDPRSTSELPGGPRPNVIVDLDVGASETILVMAHYDVVPVPVEQLPRWKSSPHTLTWRADGRLYGRGSNDDLGSGVVASLWALRRLAGNDRVHRNVRLLACCDEETGGDGGIEAMKAHDERLPERSPERFLRADVALIPDGSPHATAGSCGVVFLDGSFASPVSLSEVIDYGAFLVSLHSVARTWRSVYPSPDWPDRDAPEPVITGRATVTRFDANATASTGSTPQLSAVHAETDASNQIAQSTTLVFEGSAASLEVLASQLPALLPAPYRLDVGGPTALTVPPGARAFQVVGRSAHGGYPHRAHNPVPATLDLLRTAIQRHLIADGPSFTATFGVDLRLIPEMSLGVGQTAVLDQGQAWITVHAPTARLVVPPGRGRGGYAMAIDHPAVLKLERILGHKFGVHGVLGEYGGTDASALVGVRTPGGRPLPALVFGSMDVDAHIHEAEESVDPLSLAKISQTIEEYVLEP